MKKYLSVLMGLLCLGPLSASADSVSGLVDPITKRIPYAIQWTTDYDQALSESKATGRPLFLLFTGSDWCGWCIKLEEEALATREFAKKASEKFIFVRLDYPMKTKLDKDLTQQNRRLKRQYGIRGFPSVVIVDENERVLAQTGYEAGGGAAYAEHLLSLVPAIPTSGQTATR